MSRRLLFDDNAQMDAASQNILFINQLFIPDSAQMQEFWIARWAPGKKVQENALRGVSTQRRITEMSSDNSQNQPESRSWASRI